MTERGEVMGEDLGAVVAAGPVGIHAGDALLFRWGAPVELDFVDHPLTPSGLLATFLCAAVIGVMAVAFVTALAQQVLHPRAVGQSWESAAVFTVVARRWEPWEPARCRWDRCRGLLMIWTARSACSCRPDSDRPAPPHRAGGAGRPGPPE
ncbi:hypothetical protein BL254_23245 [Protofrankia sp. BMG5.30]|uniref:Uncharacterized protein n=1 Tax=Protofrankia coriariae TaxID=1562887 RepID=A0ABR5EZF5_9ACTN|nr:hypothetical protein FrCorBMG51_22455 [Protofrankia coriariae]ONH31334.1 hypothetical protein BL254_23245 [Protofrankia sp. BMG5.30]